MIYGKLHSMMLMLLVLSGICQAAQPQCPYPVSHPKPDGCATIKKGDISAVATIHPTKPTEKRDVLSLAAPEDFSTGENVPFTATTIGTCFPYLGNGGGTFFITYAGQNKFTITFNPPLQPPMPASVDLEAVPFFAVPPLTLSGAFFLGGEIDPTLPLHPSMAVYLDDVGSPPSSADKFKRYSIEVYDDNCGYGAPTIEKNIAKSGNLVSLLKARQPKSGPRGVGKEEASTGNGWEPK